MITNRAHVIESCSYRIGMGYDTIQLKNIKTLSQVV